MPIVIETHEEFIARHGEYVRLDTQLLFKNGARLLDTGQSSEPPEDEYALLKLRTLFRNTQLEREEKNFHSLKAYIATQAKYHDLGAGPSPEPEAVEELKRLRGVILDLRKKAGRANRKLAKHQQSVQRNARTDARMAERVKASEVITEINRIEI